MRFLWWDVEEGCRRVQQKTGCQARRITDDWISKHINSRDVQARRAPS